jgi:hypothetical protein
MDTDKMPDLDKALARLASGRLTMANLDLACSLVATVDSETARAKWPSLHKVVCCVDRDAMQAAAPNDPPPIDPVRVREYERRYASTDTEIKTADLHMVQPRPWPPGCIHGTIEREGKMFGFGFLSQRGPEVFRLDDTWYLLDKRGNLHHAHSLKLFGSWDTEDAACDAAWEAVDWSEGKINEPGKARLLELHRCERCYCLWRRQVDPVLVLPPSERVEIEGQGGQLVFEGMIKDYPAAVSDAVVVRSQREIREHELEAEHWSRTAALRGRHVTYLQIAVLAQAAVVIALVVALFAG